MSGPGGRSNPTVVDPTPCRRLRAATRGRQTGLEGSDHARYASKSFRGPASCLVRAQ